MGRIIFVAMMVFALSIPSVSFARNGNPNCPDEATDPKYSSQAYDSLSIEALPIDLQKKQIEKGWEKNKNLNSKIQNNFHGFEHDLNQSTASTKRLPW